MSRINNTIKNTSFGFIVKIVNLISHFLMRSIFIFCLGAEYNGISSLFTDILTILSFTELGISSAITYALYKPISNHDEIMIAKLMNFYKSAYRTVASIVFGLGIFCIPFLNIIITDIPNIRENICLIYVLYLINTTASYLLIYKSTLLIAAQKKYIVSRVEIGVVIGRTILQGIFLILWKNYIMYLLIMICSTLVQNLSISYKVECIYPYLKSNKETLDTKQKRELFADIKALAMYKIAGSVLGGIDSMIISITTGTIWVGLVSNYKMVIKGVDGILYQFFNAIEPSVGNLVVESDNHKQYKIFKILNLLTFWIASIVSICFLALLTPFVKIWLDDSYILDDSIVFIMIFDFYLVMMMRPIATFRTGNGLFVQGQYRPIITALINLVLSVFWGIKYKIFGVLLATIIARGMTQVWYDSYLVFSRIFYVSVKKYWCEYVYYLVSMFIVGGFTIHFTKAISGLNGISDFILKLGVSIFSSTVGVTLCICWKKEFKDVLKIVYGRILGRKR